MKRALRCGASFLWVAICLTQWLTATDALAADVTFRDLARKYFKDGEGSALAKLVGYNQPVKEVIALEYKVLLSGDDGKERCVDPKTHDFRVGDKIRLAIEPLHDCYVYIYDIGVSGKGAFLLPTDAEQPPLAKAGKPLPLPLDGFFEFSEPTGKETVLVVATEKPVANRALLASVLTKKPEQLTPEEEAVRKTIKATVREAMKSVRNKEKDLLDKTVMYRGLTTDAALQDVVKDVHTRGLTEGTFEEPSRDGAGGTCALYISTEKGEQPRLLVTIPLKSSSK
jgi:hypothetical protein